MSRGDRKAIPADLQEFGDGELAGDPSIAALIAALPEGEREAYRQERRAVLKAVGFQGTWREYFELGPAWWTNLRYAKPEPDDLLDREAQANANACGTLCSSMGLRGGVLMAWDNGLAGAARHYGSSCMCGNGMGGAVRVDPDGRETHEDDHPGPAAP